MRWSQQPLSCAAALLSVAILPSHLYVQAAPAPQAQGQPMDGAPSIAVQDIPGNPTVTHPGAPTLVAGSQETLNGLGVPAENTAVSYNDGMYTPWTNPTDQPVAASVAATEIAPVNSEYLQTSAASEAVLGETSVPVVTSASLIVASSAATTSPTSPTTPPSVSSPVESSIPTSPATSTTSTSTNIRSASAPPSTARPGTLDAARETSSSTTSSSNTTKVGVILPVVLSLGALALILGGIAFLVWRRRVARRRGLAARRYDDSFVEKGGDYDEGDEFYASKENAINPSEPWQTFNRYSAGPYDGVESGMAGAGVRSLQIPDSNADGHNAFRPRESRRPLPMTPQQISAEYSSMPAAQSTPADLDAMMAQSRTGHALRPNRLQRNTSIMSDIASSIYSSLSLRSKRSKTGMYSPSGDGEGRWNEHGAWQPIQGEYPSVAGGSPVYRPKHEPEYAAGSAQDRPLLSAVDETPRKQRYNAYTSSESPSGTGSAQADEHAGMRTTPSTHGRNALHEKIMPLYSPSSPKRTRSSASTRSEIPPDTPSIYSVATCEPMNMASPQSSYPETLQPGRSPALGRGVSPPMPSQQMGRGGLYRQRSGTTYSLGGIAGLLYNEQEQSSPPLPNAYTAPPARKARKQSVLSKYKPRLAAPPHSDEASARETDAPSPHRAVSAVVRASRARGGSVDSHYSSESHAAPRWNDDDRFKLGQSHASSDSIEDLLSNLLGPNRSPA